MAADYNYWLAQTETWLAELPTHGVPEAAIHDIRQNALRALAEAQAEIERLKAENDENCRLLGAGGERELLLLCRAEKAEAELGHVRKEVEETWKANAADAEARAEKAEAKIERLREALTAADEYLTVLQTPRSEPLNNLKHALGRGEVYFAPEEQEG